MGKFVIRSTCCAEIRLNNSLKNSNPATMHNNSFIPQCSGNGQLMVSPLNSNIPPAKVQTRAATKSKYRLETRGIKSEKSIFKALKLQRK